MTNPTIIHGVRDRDEDGVARVSSRAIGGADVRGGGPAGAVVADPVGELSRAISLWQSQQDQVASRVLAERDPTLDVLRVRIRPALEPIMTVFDAQRANAQRAATGPAATITRAGLDAALAAIAENRKGAVEAVVAPAREALAKAAAHTQMQIDKISHMTTPEDRAAATALAYELQPLTATNQIPLLTSHLRAAAAAGNIGVVIALLPYVKSLEERNPGMPALAGLISTANKATATWQHTVSRARLARIERMQWELGELATAAVQGGPDAEMTFRLPGYELLTEDDERPTSAAEPAPRPQPTLEPEPSHKTPGRAKEEQRWFSVEKARWLAADEDTRGSPEEWLARHK